MPFWLAAIVTSTPHASISNRSQPIDAMQSTTKRADDPDSAIERPMASMSLRTEIAVSTWTARTAANSSVGPAASRAATASGSTGERGVAG